MFQKRNKNQGKQKKPRVLSIGTRRPVVIALWALLICAFAFAVYKDFTAVDTHTVHETTVVQEEVTDTNAIESFVTNFAKVYYSCAAKGEHNPFEVEIDKLKAIKNITNDTDFTIEDLQILRFILPNDSSTNKANSRSYLGSYSRRVSTYSCRDICKYKEKYTVPDREYLPDKLSLRPNKLLTTQTVRPISYRIIDFFSSL